MVSSVAAQSAGRSVAKVVRVKGGARTPPATMCGAAESGRRSEPGTVIQTQMMDHLFDLALGDGEAPMTVPGPSSPTPVPVLPVSYLRPPSRIWFGS